ncbi:MAG: MoxR family ATPase [Deltaproteobacteria bacterium]|nr:MoxR family ATPase [Deltaproteobacteria bacterium]
MTKFIPDEVIDKDNIIEPHGGMDRTVHVFDADSVAAVNAALAARRPLLVRGEPGIGKSQLARAAAEVLGRAFVSFTVDNRTESHELMWHFDAVARLAEAQLVGVSCTCGEDDSKLDKPDPRERLAMTHFISPGPLWWGMDWSTAQKQKGTGATRCMVHKSAKCNPANGVVVLIDEIDKADASVPNGLLECLGNRSFTCCDGTTVDQSAGEPPLVIVTTNEERSLPDPFLRRCVVLQLDLPQLPQYKEDFVAYLTRLGRAHDADNRLSDDVLSAAAEMLVGDRIAVGEKGLCPPGCAEYLDLLAALKTLPVNGGAGHDEMMKTLGRFFYRKHRESAE